MVAISTYQKKFHHSHILKPLESCKFMDFSGKKNKSKSTFFCFSDKSDICKNSDFIQNFLSKLEALCTPVHTEVSLSCLSGRARGENIPHFLYQIEHRGQIQNSVLPLEFITQASWCSSNPACLLYWVEGMHGSVSLSIIIVCVCLLKFVIVC